MFCSLLKRNLDETQSSYVSASPYAEGVDFKEAVDSAIELAKAFPELDDLD